MHNNNAATNNECGALSILRSSFVGIIVVLGCYSRNMLLVFMNIITLFIDSNTVKSVS